MPTSTTNYSLQKPLVNNATDQDLWGSYLNDDMDDIDTLIRQGICNTVASSQTSGFTAVSTISVRNFYPCDATGGAFAATLPTAASAGNGGTVAFKKTDSSANAITITRAGADTIDGATTQAISNQYDCYVLVSNGVSAWHIMSEPAATPTVPVLKKEIFTSSGTFTTPSATVASTVFKFTVTGGGGGGSGGLTAGAGGGAGGTAIYWASGLAASTGYTVTIGAAGTAGSSGGGAGGNGGDSTVVLGVTTITGGGGTGGSGSGNAPVGGAGGSATNGDINITGGSGTCGSWSAQLNTGGTGGTSFWGGGGTGGSTSGSTNAGATGASYGSGGGGNSGGAIAAGGAGKAGVVQVEWVL